MKGLDLSKKCLDCCYQINCQNMKKCWKQCCPVLGQSLLSAMAIPGTKTLQVTICNMKEGYLTPFITCIYQRKCSLSGRICLFDRSLWTYSWRSSTFVIGFGALLFIFVLLRWNWIFSLLFMNLYEEVVTLSLFWWCNLGFRGLESKCANLCCSLFFGKMWLNFFNKLLVSCKGNLTLKVRNWVL